MRNTDKNGVYTMDGRPGCLGGWAMQYAGTHAQRGHLFHCPTDRCRLNST